MKKFIFECCEKYYETIKHELYRPDGFVFRDDKGNIIDTNIIYIERADLRREKIKANVIDYLINNYIKEPVTIEDNYGLTIDSLDKIEIAMWLEKEYNIEISNEEALDWSFFSDIIKSIDSKVK